MGRLDTQAAASLLHMMSSWSRKDNIIEMGAARCSCICTCTCACTSTYNSGKVCVLTYTVAGRQVPPRTPHQGWKRSRLATRQSLEIQSTAKPRTGETTISKKAWPTYRMCARWASLEYTTGRSPALRTQWSQPVNDAQKRREGWFGHRRVARLAQRGRLHSLRGHGGAAGPSHLARVRDGRRGAILHAHRASAG